MTPFAIAGLQLDLPANGDHLAAIVRRIDAVMDTFPWVQMVLLSELVTYGSSLAHVGKLAEAERAYCEAAAKHRLWLVPGSLYESVDDHIYNVTPVINPRGEIIARYRKLFPFRPYEAGVSAGDRAVVFDVPGVGRFGISNCYDMWFPETTRQLVAQGAEVILHPTMTGTIDRDLELAIARTNAATGQCFFFDINGAGGLGNGRSIVVGPHGEVLHQAGAGQEVIPLEIDLSQVRRSRERGLLGLGQVLKSFRDRSIRFTAYDDHSDYLESLGPLIMAPRSPTEGDPP